MSSDLTLIQANQLVGRVVETRFDPQAWGLRSLWRPRVFADDPDLGERFGIAARTYRDVPWSDHGRTRFGLNCTGLPIVAAADIGVVIDEPPFTHRVVGPGEMAEALARYCDRLPMDVSQARPGDIALGVGLDLGGHHATHLGILARAVAV